jgi:hypothetical protein
MRRVIAILATVGAFAAAAPCAIAGVATYTSTDVPKHVFDDTGPDGIPSTLAVPGGRTAIQSIEVTNFGYGWPASGQELSAQLLAPDGTSMFLFEVGCFDSPSNASFTITDSATALADGEDVHCTNDFLLGGSLRPDDPQAKKLSIFNGRSPSGVWTLRSIDNGVLFTNQGDLNRWALRINHAPPTLTATAPKRRKLSGKLAVTATSNADGNVSLGGSVKQATQGLDAGQPASIPFKVKKKVRAKIEKKGKAQVKVDLAFTDETGGTATSSVTVVVKDPG